MLLQITIRCVKREWVTTLLILKLHYQVMFIFAINEEEMCRIGNVLVRPQCCCWILTWASSKQIKSNQITFIQPKNKNHKRSTGIMTVVLVHYAIYIVISSNYWSYLTQITRSTLLSLLERKIRLEIADRQTAERQRIKRSWNWKKEKTRDRRWAARGFS